VADRAAFRPVTTTVITAIAPRSSVAVMAPVTSGRSGWWTRSWARSFCSSSIRRNRSASTTLTTRTQVAPEGRQAVPVAATAEPSSARTHISP
jgi:hypothetical protein